MSSVFGALGSPTLGGGGGGSATGTTNVNDDGSFVNGKIINHVGETWTALARATGLMGDDAAAAASGDIPGSTPQAQRRALGVLLSTIFIALALAAPVLHAVFQLLPPVRFGFGFAATRGARRTWEALRRNLFMGRPAPAPAPQEDQQQQQPTPQQQQEQRQLQQTLPQRQRWKVKPTRAVLRPEPLSSSSTSSETDDTASGETEDEESDDEGSAVVNRGDSDDSGEAEVSSNGDSDAVKNQHHRARGGVRRQRDAETTGRVDSGGADEDGRQDGRAGNNNNNTTPVVVSRANPSKAPPRNPLAGSSSSSPPPLQATRSRPVARSTTPRLTSLVRGKQTDAARLGLTAGVVGGHGAQQPPPPPPPPPQPHTVPQKDDDGSLTSISEG